jgi:hypothetical protein
MTRTLTDRRSPLAALACGILLLATPARADEVLFTFGEMLHLQGLPLDSAKRSLSDEEVILYQNFELYAYTVFESLQAANDAALLIHREPLFCPPAAAFHFRKEGDIAKLADYVTSELLALTKEVGGSLDRYDDKPASAVLLLGLRAAFPCEEQASQLAQR